VPVPGDALEGEVVIGREVAVQAAENQITASMIARR